MAALPFLSPVCAAAASARTHCAHQRAATAFSLGRSPSLPLCVPSLTLPYLARELTLYLTFTLWQLLASQLLFHGSASLTLSSPGLFNVVRLASFSTLPSHLCCVKALCFTIVLLYLSTNLIVAINTVCDRQEVKHSRAGRRLRNKSQPFERTRCRVNGPIVYIFVSRRSIAIEAVVDQTADTHAQPRS